ncbi:hypothetical protein T484DRAFT_1816680 [Baffinella frigidus]|nr:hypothetical protein T484DRAFT_1816680 [Cryptophyta sp. CCMP2293]
MRKACAALTLELIDGAKLALTTITRDPNGFVNTAQELIPKIEAMTRKATQLAPPTADASFDHLHLNLTPVGVGGSELRNPKPEI